MEKRTAKNFGLNDSSRVHLFFERSGTFKKAFEKYGFIAPLRPDLHPNGAQGEKDAETIDTILKQRCQLYYEEHYGTREQFRKEFGKSYL